MINGLPLEDLKRVGTALAKLRDSKHLSQRQLAKRCRVASATISNIEAGKAFDFLSRLTVLDDLGVQIGDFLVDAGFTDERTSYRTYTFTITAEASRLRHITGKVEGPGISRATK
jgi:transcriptional regulator with XRE-family HTH domain